MKFSKLFSILLCSSLMVSVGTSALALEGESVPISVDTKDAISVSMDNLLENEEQEFTFSDPNDQDFTVTISAVEDESSLIPMGRTFYYSTANFIRVKQLRFVQLRIWLEEALLVQRQ